MGVVTVTDPDSSRPEDLCVQDIMILRRRIEVLRLQDVSEAGTGQVLSSLRRAGRRHALVLDDSSGDEKKDIRGIFSLTRPCGQIGLDIQPYAPMDGIESAMQGVLDWLRLRCPTAVIGSADRASC